MSTTTLTFEEGASSKFYVLALADTTLTIRFGRIGSQGQEKCTTFKTPALALKEYERLLAEKKKKGYVEKKKARSAADPPTKKATAKGRQADDTKGAKKAPGPPPGPPGPALEDPPVAGLDLASWRASPIPIPERDPTPLPTGDFVVEGYTIAFGDDEEVQIRDPKGKRLKSVPAKVRQSDDYQALMRGRKDDRSRGKRARRVLEERMISGTPIVADELAWLVQDAAFEDLFRGLVVVADGSPERAPAVLVGWDSTRGLGVVPLDYDAKWIGWPTVTIPHPSHLSDLTEWQDLLIELGLQQGLAQVFREVKSVPAAQRTLQECTMVANRETRSAAAIERALMDDGWTARRGMAKRHLWLREGDAITTVEAWFDYGEYYMPSDETTTGAFGVNDVRGRPLPMSAVPGVLLGEIIRSLELACSQAGSKKDDAEDDERDASDAEDTDADDANEDE